MKEHEGREEKAGKAQGWVWRGKQEPDGGDRVLCQSEKLNFCLKDEHEGDVEKG